MAIRVIDDTKLKNIAVAIQAKDNGGRMTVDEMAGRIEAIPTGSEFDMTVESKQVKMVIEVTESDKSFWTRFGATTNSTVTIDWGDESQVSYDYDRDSFLEYAPQIKHVYAEADKYLITITVENGTLTIGSIAKYSTLSEGPIVGNINSFDVLRKIYNSKIKELSYGSDVVINAGLDSIPCLTLHNPVDFTLYDTLVYDIIIKDGVTTISEYQFNNTMAYIIKIPNSVTTISNQAFGSAKIKTLDFTSIRLNENGELPITFTSSNVFQNTSNSMVLLFATQEIAEVAKTTTNLSQIASRIKYVGEV